MKWETSLSEMQKAKAMVLVEDSDKDTKVYLVKGEKLRIGGANLESIKYLFWKDKLSDVMITTKGKIDFERLKAATVEKFGKGLRDNQLTEEYIWSVGGPTGIILTYDPINKEGNLLLEARELHKQQDAINADLTKRGAEEDF